MEKVISKSDQLDLFVADILDIAPKGEMKSMEYPIFAISSKPDKKPFRFDADNGNWLEIIPSSVGRATIHDKDLLLYCIGHIVEALNRGRAISRRVKITAYDYLVTTNRPIDGKSYSAIGDTIARLRGTTFKSNIMTPASKRGDIFGLIDSGSMVTGNNGRLEHIEIVISEHLYNSITSPNQILTYNHNYFKLRSPYDRRMYELSRKHCGNQVFWEIGLEKLYKKFGVRSPLKEFRRKIKELVEKQAIPDYFIEYQVAETSGAIEKIVVYRDKDAKIKAHMAKNTGKQGLKL